MVTGREVRVKRRNYGAQTVRTKTALGEEKNGYTDPVQSLEVARKVPDRKKGGADDGE